LGDDPQRGSAAPQLPQQAAPHPIEKAFSADPFDPRFYKASPTLTLTPLGIMVQTFDYLRQHLMRECPDAVKFLETFNDQAPDNESGAA
jgi:hypothetical protein